MKRSPRPSWERLAWVMILAGSCLCCSPLPLNAQDTSAGSAAQRTLTAESGDGPTRDAEALWDAARAGDVAAIAAELDDGVSVDVRTAYGSTALCFACDRGHLEAVRLLLQRGADPNVSDTFYKATPLSWAQSNGHIEIIGLLLAAGADGADDVLMTAVGTSNVELAKAAIQSTKASAESLAIAYAIASAQDKEQIIQLFEEVEFDKLSEFRPDADALASYVGIYSMASGGFQASVVVAEDGLKIQLGANQPATLTPIEEHHFIAGTTRVKFEVVEGEANALMLSFRGTSVPLRRTTDDAAAPATTDAGESPGSTEPPPDADREAIVAWKPSEDDRVVSSVNWPGFRGTESRGVADGQRPPVTWNAEDGTNILWQVPIAGLGNSCPVIWGDRLFLTSAVSAAADNSVRIGQYGNVDSVEDDSEYEFVVICFDKHSGDLIWQRTPHVGRPAVKRHSKSSHANPTVATDGRCVIAFFGSEGLYCYDLEGNLLWQKDLGFLDSGWFLDAGYQWGFGSSPLIFDERVIVQCDVQKNSFVAAFDEQTGEVMWRTERDEIPTWSTPVVHRFGDLPMLITHGTRAARGYDARDGQLLWSVPGHSEIVVPTPVVAHDLIYVASGYAPVQPIVAIQPTARGEIEIPDRQGETGSELDDDDAHIAWSTLRGGPYMPTPIVYGDYLYTCANNGILTCYRANTGQEVYKQRLKTGGNLSFTASPIAADGYLYFAAEDGRVAVVRAGPSFEMVSVNPVGGNVLATPAISDGTFYVRTTTHLIACREPELPNENASGN